MVRQMEVQHDALIKTVEAIPAPRCGLNLRHSIQQPIEVLRQVSPLSERLSIVEEKRGR